MASPRPASLLTNYLPNTSSPRLLSMPTHPRSLATPMATHRLLVSRRQLQDILRRPRTCQPSNSVHRKRLQIHQGLEWDLVLRNHNKMELQGPHRGTIHAWVYTKCPPQVPTSRTQTTPTFPPHVEPTPIWGNTTTSRPRGHDRPCIGPPTKTDPKSHRHPTFLRSSRRLHHAHDPKHHRGTTI
jgi:hypothetical protein